jgi:hypothetical protein
VVLGSDGLFDNLFDHELAATVTVRSGPYNSIGVSARCYRGLQFNWGFQQGVNKVLTFQYGFHEIQQGEKFIESKRKMKITRAEQQLR